MPTPWDQRIDDEPFIRSVLAAIGAALVVANTGCDPAYRTCSIACSPSGRCPSGFFCNTADGFCHEADEPPELLCALGGGADAGRPDPPVGFADATPELIDAGPFVCADDSNFEPNESRIDATLTSIGIATERFELVGLSICRDTDVDMFEFSIEVSGKDLAAQISYPSRQSGDLRLDVLNALGTPIRPGTPTSGDDTEVLRVEILNMPKATYYVKVRAPAGHTNNYDLVIVTSGP